MPLCFCSLIPVDDSAYLLMGMTAGIKYRV